MHHIKIKTGLNHLQYRYFNQEKKNKGTVICMYICICDSNPHLPLHIVCVIFRLKNVHEFI